MFEGLAFSDLFFGCGGGRGIDGVPFGAAGAIGFHLRLGGVPNGASGAGGSALRRITGAYLKEGDGEDQENDGDRFWDVHKSFFNSQ
jgi:hypothetical protein